MAFSFGSQTHWLRGGDRGTEEYSLSPTHTQTHTDRKDSSNCGGVQEDTRRVWDRGDVETSINHRRLITVATVLSLAKLVTPKQNTHMHWLTKQHTTTAVRKASENTHTHTKTVRSTAAHVTIRATWPQAMTLSVGSCVLHKTSVTLKHREERVCVCACVSTLQTTSESPAP